MSSLHLEVQELINIVGLNAVNYDRKVDFFWQDVINRMIDEAGSKFFEMHEIFPRFKKSTIYFLDVDFSKRQLHSFLNDRVKKPLFVYAVSNGIQDSWNLPDRDRLFVLFKECIEEKGFNLLYIERNRKYRIYLKCPDGHEAFNNDRKYQDDNPVKKNKSVKTDPVIPQYFNKDWNGV